MPYRGVIGDAAVGKRCSGLGHRTLFRGSLLGWRFIGCTFTFGGAACIRRAREILVDVREELELQEAWRMVWEWYGCYERGIANHMNWLRGCVWGTGRGDGACFGRRGGDCRG